MAMRYGALPGGRTASAGGLGFDSGHESTDAARKHTEAARFWRLVAFVEEDLKSEADAEVRCTPRDVLDEHVPKAAFEGGGTRAERSLTNCSRIPCTRWPS